MSGESQYQIGFIEDLLNEKKLAQEKLKHEIRTLTETLRILRRAMREDHGSQIRLIPSNDYAGLSLGKAIGRALKDTGEYLSISEVTNILINGSYQTGGSHRNLEASIGTTLRRAWKGGYLDREKRGRRYKYRPLSEEEREERKERGGGSEESEAAQELESP